MHNEVHLADNLLHQKNLKVDKNKMQSLLKWNARLSLGKEIKSCIEKKGRCHFEAEL